MYIVSFVLRLVGVVTVLFAVPGFSGLASGQTPAAQRAQTTPDEHASQEMAREGSGTSWLPDQSPMYALHRMKGAWTLMFHENAFVQFLHESGTRGDEQTGSINWMMGMVRRNIGPGRLGFRGMVSAEPWTIRGCGYPDLLATGEECGGQKIHDRQHPHDLLMELAADFNAPVKGDLRWQLYAAAAGEPALGPVAFPHRVSALPNPHAPISHHWLDSTHITFGVVTAGLYATKWKAETSVFNGREPDEKRTDFDFAALDSFSGRLWFLPTSRLALQISAGHLKDAEPGEAGGAAIDVDRVTASVTYHQPVRDDGIWATTVAWGRNAEAGHESNALLAETNLTLNAHDSMFGRFEVAGKSAHDLEVPEPPDSFTVAKLQGGYSRYLAPRSGFQPGLGAGLSLGFVPSTLKAAYGGRVNAGFAVFLTIRPAAMSPDAHAAHTQGGQAGGDGMVMVQTAFDPWKLTCSPPVDRDSAAQTTYEGRTYYFCSPADRDLFLTDPKMSLSMMPPKQ